MGGRESNCVVILGMHRSGTSALTRFIMSAGFSLPGEPLPPHAEDNAGGYWEPKELVYANHGFLNAAIGGWKSTLPMHSGLFESDQAKQLQDQVSGFLDHALVRSKNLVLKDPRLCRLYPIYGPVIKELFDHVLLIQMVRHPEEVARSLAQRSKIPDIANAAVENPLHGRLLWLRYNLDARVWQELAPIHLMDYEHWLQQEAACDDFWQLLRETFPEVCLVRPVPEIRPPRFHADKIADTAGPHESADIVVAYYRDLIGERASAAEAALRDAFDVRIPEVGQTEVSAPDFDLVASAQWKHATGLVNACCSPAGIERVKTDAPIVLFISDRPSIACHIYRVKNMVDLLNGNGIRARWLTSVEALECTALLRSAKLVVIHRSFFGDSIAAVVDRCHRFSTPIAGDIDDLIFDAELIENGEIDFVRLLEQAEQQTWIDKANSFAKTLFAGDLCIASTDAIRSHIAELGRSAVCIPNSFGNELVALSELWKHRFDTSKRPRRLVYASGSATHNRDFDVIADAVGDFLTSRPDWVLTLVGALDLGRHEGRFRAEQLERRRLVPHVNLAYELARCDINLIPLTRNRFNDAKSPLKWYESALCGVPTIATSNPLYVDCLREGAGVLAETVEDWSVGLDYLSGSEARRRNIAQRARERARDLCGPETVLSGWKSLLREFA